MESLFFLPENHDYNPWFDICEHKNVLRKSMPPEKKQKKKSNDASFSCIAPSSGKL